MRRLVIPLLVLGALVAGACSWRSDVAASVDGRDISASDLEADARALIGQPAFADLYLNSSVDAEAKTADMRLPTSALAVLLSRRISDLMVQSELSARGITVPDSAVQAAESDLAAQLAEREAQNQTGQGPNLRGAFAQLPAALRTRVLRAEASATALRDELAAKELASFPADARAYFDAHPEVFAQYCLVSIPVDDEVQGKALVRQTQGGTTLGELVARQKGQDEGCAAGYQLDQLPGDLADGLRSAKAGAVIGPFQGQSSLLLVGLTSRTVPPYEQVAAEADTQYRQARSTAEDPAWKAWLANKKPRVDVDPRYGTWDPARFQVEPPAPPRSS
jgi:hypothetical protein